VSLATGRATISRFAAEAFEEAPAAPVPLRTTTLITNKEKAA
jgi:hypothetical protein